MEKWAWLERVCNWKILRKPWQKIYGMALLNVSGVWKFKENKPIVEEISFVQQPMENIAIAGETGSGKSTLLKIIAGLIQPDKGAAFFNDRKIEGPNERLIPGHPGIAYLSQHFELRNNYRVEEILEYANELSDPEAKEIFHICRIGHLLHRKTDQLSGGEKQRIAIARLLISSPQLLILDEPYSNLDMDHKQAMKAVIKDIDARLNISCILVSHDPSDILSWANEIIVLKDGKIVQKGVPQDIYFKPANEYVAGLFGKFNTVKKDDKEYFIRPEKIKVHIGNKANENLEPGHVTSIHFFGSYYEMEVRVGDQLMLVRTIDNEHQIDDEVQLDIDYPDSK